MKSIIKIIFITIFGISISSITVEHCCSKIEKVSKTTEHDCHSEDEKHTEENQEHCKMDCCHQSVSNITLNTLNFYSSEEDYHFINQLISQTKNFHLILYRPPIS